MHHTDIRTAAIGLTSGVIATVATIAFVDADLSTRITEAVLRWRLTTAERAEYDRIRLAQTQRCAESTCKTEWEQIGIRAKFRQGLLSGYAETMPLAQLSVTDLISEIGYAKTRKCEEITATLASDGRGQALVWGPQVEALRSEFQRRAGEDMSFIDRTRYHAAYSVVNRYDDEWPLPLDEVPGFVPYVAVQPRTFPTHPDFPGYDSADEAQTVTTTKE